MTNYKYNIGMYNAIYKEKKIKGGHIWFFPILFVLLTLCSCQKFLQIDQPDSQLTKSAVFEDSITATGAMTDIYGKMRESGVIYGRTSGLSCLLGTYADELISFEHGIYTTATFYSNSLLPSFTYVSSIWNNSYSQIYAANAVIHGVENSSTLAATVKSQLKGEALFVRAFLHLHLVNLYGAVPYITTTDYRLNSMATRTAVETVYQNIIADLNSAISLLPSHYIHPERTRPNRAAAQALLSRVYLYSKNYASAGNMAASVINANPLYTLESDLAKVFLKQSRSTIWQLSTSANGANTMEGSTFIFLAGPPTRVSLTEELVNQFETNDLRKSHWVKSVTTGSQVWYHPFKYKQNNPTGTTTVENPIVFRLEEQYLIRAEAKVKLGDLTGAKEDLNVIRNRAGLPNTSAISENEILEAILQERRVELFTEYGQRFYDLKRLNKLDIVLHSKAGWNSTDSLWPLPQAEMNANPFLTPQNPGY